MSVEARDAGQEAAMRSGGHRDVQRRNGYARRGEVVLPAPVRAIGGIIPDTPHHASWLGTIAAGV